MAIRIVINTDVSDEAMVGSTGWNDSNARASVAEYQQLKLARAHEYLVDAGFVGADVAIESNWMSDNRIEVYGVGRDDTTNAEQRIIDACQLAGEDVYQEGNFWL